MTGSTRVVHENVWKEIRQACRGPGRRYAAIAFVGVDAPRMLPLRRGDVLVVNASQAALRSHATSPVALRALVAKGVEVWSNDSLHAKVIATPTTAVVGSANASRNSEKHLVEAATVTNQQSVIEVVRSFVDEMVAVEVDDAFLDFADDEWAKGRDTPLNRLGESIELTGRLFVAATHYGSVTQSGRDAAKRLRSSARRKGHVTGWQVDYFYDGGRGARWRTGDILVCRYDDGSLDPPHLVLSLTAKTVYLLRTVPGLPDRTNDDVRRVLQKAPDLRPTHSRSLRA